MTVRATSEAYSARVRADPNRYSGAALLARPSDIADLLAAVHRLLDPAVRAAKEEPADPAERAVGVYEAGGREGER